VNSSGSDCINVGAIVGGTIGGIAGVVMIIAAIWFYKRKVKQQELAKAILTDRSQEMRVSGTPV
jgi:hypothetical protein